MEQCACVERELEKVLHRFVIYGHQSEERLDELLRSVCEIRAQLVAFGKMCTLPCLNLFVVMDSFGAVSSFLSRFSYFTQKQ